MRIKNIKKTEPLIFFNFFNSGNYFWNSGRPEVGNNYFLIFSILETLISRIKKTEPPIFLIFLILEILILRIKKIKKTEPLILVIFLILEIIFGILKGQKLETIIFLIFSIFLILETIISRIKKIKKTEPPIFLFF